MLIPGKSVLGVRCYQYNHINSDKDFIFTFVTHSGHFWLKKSSIELGEVLYRIDGDGLSIANYTLKIRFL